MNQRGGPVMGPSHVRGCASGLGIRRAIKGVYAPLWGAHRHFSRTLRPFFNILCRKHLRR
jgi:hypothetical protein